MATYASATSKYAGTATAGVTYQQRTAAGLPTGQPAPVKTVTAVDTATGQAVEAVKVTTLKPGVVKTEYVPAAEYQRQQMAAAAAKAAVMPARENYPGFTGRGGSAITRDVAEAQRRGYEGDRMVGSSLGPTPFRLLPPGGGGVIRELHARSNVPFGGGMAGVETPESAQRRGFFNLFQRHAGVYLGSFEAVEPKTLPPSKQTPFTSGRFDKAAALREQQARDWRRLGVYERQTPTAAVAERGYRVGSLPFLFNIGAPAANAPAPTIALSPAEQKAAVEKQMQAGGRIGTEGMVVITPISGGKGYQYGRYETTTGFKTRTPSLAEGAFVWGTADVLFNVNTKLAPIAATASTLKNFAIGAASYLTYEAGKVVAEKTLTPYYGVVRKTEYALAPAVREPYKAVTESPVGPLGLIPPVGAAMLTTHYLGKGFFKAGLGLQGVKGEEVERFQRKSYEKFYGVGGESERAARVIFPETVGMTTAALTSGGLSALANVGSTALERRLYPKTIPVASLGGMTAPTAEGKIVGFYRGGVTQELPGRTFISGLQSPVYKGRLRSPLVLTDYGKRYFTEEFGVRITPTPAALDKIGASVERGVINIKSVPPTERVEYYLTRRELAPGARLLSGRQTGLFEVGGKTVYSREPISVFTKTETLPFTFRKAPGEFLYKTPTQPKEIPKVFVSGEGAPLTQVYSKSLSESRLGGTAQKTEQFFKIMGGVEGKEKVISGTLTKGTAKNLEYRLGTISTPAKMITAKPPEEIAKGSYGGKLFGEIYGKKTTQAVLTKTETKQIPAVAEQYAPKVAAVYKQAAVKIPKTYSRSIYSYMPAYTTGVGFESVVSGKYLAPPTAVVKTAIQPLTQKTTDLGYGITNIGKGETRRQFIPPPSNRILERTIGSKTDTGKILGREFELRILQGQGQGQTVASSSFPTASTVQTVSGFGGTAPVSYVPPIVPVLNPIGSLGLPGGGRGLKVPTRFGLRSQLRRNPLANVDLFGGSRKYTRLIGRGNKATRRLEVGTRKTFKGINKMFKKSKKHRR